MTKYYDELTISYPGYDRILELLSQNYYLFDVRKYVETYVATCNIYTRVKVLHYKPFSLLQLLLIPDRVWELVLTDFIVKLLPSRDSSQLKGGKFNSI